MKRTNSYLGLLLVLLAWTAGVAVSYCEEEDPLKYRPLKELPESIHPASDKVTLFADFSTKSGGNIRLYLINNTSSDASVPTQDGDVYAKREAKIGDNEWKRCDSHSYSWCGNSYLVEKIPAQTFRSWLQKCDSSDGSERPIRYRMYQKEPWNLESNAGTARVSDTDLATCRYDAMAMKHAPFEDVMAVATGKVKGGQGASIDGIDSAIQALSRFPQDKRLFPVVKEIIESLPRQDSDVLRPGYRYQTCLETLSAAMKASNIRAECWTYVSDQVRDPKFPWSGEALSWLLRPYQFDMERLKPLVDFVLSEPDHPALNAAVIGYRQIVEKGEAGIKLRSIAADERYPKSTRDNAKQAMMQLFPNPFVSLKVVEGRSSDKQLPPIKLAEITNIAPQAITFPVSSAVELLIVEVKSEEGEICPMKRPPAKTNGQLRLEPGEKIEIKDVEWWQLVDWDRLPQSKHFVVSFGAASPGLWEIPTFFGSSRHFERDELLKGAANSKEK